MATPPKRLRYGGGGGGLDLTDIAHLFGNAGGGEVAPDTSATSPTTDYPYDWTKDVPRTTAPIGAEPIKFKPTHPVLNALSGFAGSELANQQNLEQVLQAQEYARKLDTMQKAADIQQTQLAREMFIKDTGHLPSERPDEFQSWIQSGRLLELSKAQTEQAKTLSELGTQRNIQAKGVESTTFPYREISAVNRAAGDIPTSLTEQYTAEKGLELSPYAATYKKMAAEDAIKSFAQDKLIEDARKATAVSPYGVYHYLTGQKEVFPTFQQQLTEPLMRQALGSQAGNVKPQIGSVGYDPLYGNIVRKPIIAVAAAPISAKPFTGNIQAPSTPFATVPVSPIGGTLGTQLNDVNSISNAIENLNPDTSALGYPSVPLRSMNLQDLQALYNKLISQQRQ